MMEAIVRSRQLRAAIIGCGNIAGGYDHASGDGQILTHAKAYTRHPATQLVAVADTDRDRAQAFAKRWQVPAAYGDPRQMLAETRPEVVSICTPDDTHAEWLAACLEFPVRAVWCEKPLVTEEGSGERLVAAYEEQGIPLAVNYHRRWDRSLQHLGDTVQATCESPVKAVVLYGKGLRHSGSHAVDLLLAWLGPVQRIRALSTVADYTETDPTVTACLEFANGSEVYLVGVDDRRYSLWEIDLLGPSWRFRITQAGLRVETHSVQINPRDARETLLDPNPSVSSTELDTVIYQALDNIVGAVRSQQPLRSTGRTALATLRVCNAMIRASAPEWQGQGICRP